MFENVGPSLAQLSEEKEISIELLKEVIESTIILALKKKYGSDINFHIEFDEQNNPTIYKSVVVVEDVMDKNKQISFVEAKKLDGDINLGDEVFIIVDQVEAFGRIESIVGKTTFLQKIAELERNLIYKEFKRRENQIVNGYFQREYKGNIYVNLGKAEGTLLKRDQSPREHYSESDRIRAYIYSVENDRSGHPTIYLTRTKGDFIRKLFELEIPEVADGTIEIKNVVRQPGLKTKVAVSSNKAEVDPVGGCIGQKGARIQSIIKEIEGEKIDVVKWSKDIREYIYEALTPAKPTRIIITDADKREAMIIVPDEQLSLALGRGGYNIKLASQLTNYYFDLKTESDIKANPELLKDIIPLSQIFSDSAQNEDENTQIVESQEEKSNLYSLEDIDEEIINKLIDSGIDSIETLYHLKEAEIISMTGFDEDTVRNIIKILKESVEVIEDNKEGKEYAHIEEEIVEEIEVYECPNCGAEITEDMKKCPSCGIDISFE